MKKKTSDETGCTQVSRFPLDAFLRSRRSRRAVCNWQLEGSRVDEINNHYSQTSREAGCGDAFAGLYLVL